MAGPYTVDRDRLRRALHRGDRVHERSEEGYELHIDRQLPFLCVHRRPADGGDADTASLLSGQAAHLIASGAAALHRETVDLVDTVSAAQSEAFGSFLLIELWSRDVSDAPSTPAPAPSFLVHASQEVSNALLSRVENALLEVELRRRRATVQTVFEEGSAPPGLLPLMTSGRMRELDCIALGIEIDAIYREPETGAVLPFALRALRRRVAHALRMIAYHFSHDQTRYYPEHFQELGPRAVTDIVLDIDGRLAEISENFDLLLHVTPVNAAAAWAEFRECAFERAPTFHYRPRGVDPALLKRDLYQVPVEQAEDPIFIDLFASKRDELDRQLTLLGDRGTGKFIHGSIQVFGHIENELLATAETLIALDEEADAGEVGALMGPEELAARAREELEFYRATDPTLASVVEVRDDVTGILVSHGNFIIGGDASASEARLRATLAHEIGTHALTYHNGKQQPLRQLYAGFAGYEELQEGLAVLAEYLAGGLTRSRLRLLAGRVIAVHCILQGADFVETFRHLERECHFEPHTAFTMTMRIFRGGGYTKDMIYLRGFLRLLDYLAGDGKLELLYCGKIAMEHLHLVEEMHWRRVLRPIALKPRYLTDRLPRRRLDALRKDATLEHILERMT
jgi:uncharacterized protein (TIGR02421 family)